MASTYSTSLRLELMATGDQSGTWGVTTNTNLGTLLEQAITGVLSVAQGDAELTLTASDGASDQARNMVVDLTGAMTSGQNVIVPTAEKVYLIKNSTTGGFDVTVKTAAGSGVAIAAGTSQWVYCDGTGVVAALTGTLATQPTAAAQITTIELGHATDTTLARAAAGVLSVEGNQVPSPASQTEGDILYRGASGWTRLPKGLAEQLLTMNSGATAPEWADASAGGGPSLGARAIIRTNETNIKEDIDVWELNTAVTADTAADTLDAGTDDGFDDGDVVQFATTDTLPAGLAVETDYYVISVAAGTSQVSTTYGGSNVDITDTGTGTHTMYRCINGSTAGPVTIESGVTVDVKSGCTWNIL